MCTYIHLCIIVVIEVNIQDIAHRSAGFVLGDYVTLLSKAKLNAFKDLVKDRYQTSIHINTHTYTYIHIHTQTHTYIHTHIHTYIYTYNTYIYTYIHRDGIVSCFRYPNRWIESHNISIHGILIQPHHLNTALDNLHSLHSGDIGAPKVIIYMRTYIHENSINHV